MSFFLKKLVYIFIELERKSVVVNVESGKNGLFKGINYLLQLPPFFL